MAKRAARARRSGGAGRAAGAPGGIAKVKKVRATFHIAADLFEQCRDAVVYLSGPPLRLTLAGLADEALRRELARLQRTSNHGDPFPPRQSELKGGRPIKA